MGGDFHREAREDWMTYVHRSIQLCRHVMKEEQQSWDQRTFLPQNDPAMELTRFWRGPKRKNWVREDT
jgi:hypothetical protein